jgi:predicted dehydrogenase
MNQPTPARRQFVQSAAGALTTSIFTGNIRGANDRISAGFIGVGTRGKQLMSYAMAQPGLAVAAVCDVKQDAREAAYAKAAAQGHQPKKVKDFRDVVADKSIDVAVIATPEHWHAYLTIEACKAGKDVYVEKPLCAGIDEGLKMVAAARRYNRIVSSGTWQRAGDHFQRAVEMVQSGRLGKLFLARTFNYFWKPPAGDGNPPDSEPPAGIDWDMWLGPAPKRPYNFARAAYGSYRKYWDYGGGVMTDWGVHWIDIVQMALGEAMPLAASGFGGKFWFQDDRDVPDTLQVAFQYPNNVLATFETRAGNAQTLFKASMPVPPGRDQGIVFHASKATMILDRDGYRIIPERKSDLKEEENRSRGSEATALKQWTEFYGCLRTRQRPVSDVEKTFRSTTACILGNAAVRSGQTVHFDSEKFTAREPEARKYLTRQHRPPWELSV